MQNCMCSSLHCSERVGLFQTFLQRPRFRPVVSLLVYPCFELNLNVNDVISLLADAVFDEWSPFSTCTATCGEGDQLRMRSCIVNEMNCIPTPTSGDCDGELLQTEQRCCVAFDDCGKKCSHVITSSGTSIQLNLYKL